MENVIILAAGQGKRMKSDIPKPMFEVLGEPMLEWVIKACRDAGLDNICIVKGFMSGYIDEYIKGEYETVFQEQRLGTAHAAMQAVPFLEKNLDSDTLILCGDAPFIDSGTIGNALAFHKKENNAVTVITASVENPEGYGRIIRDENGVRSIVEEKDAEPAEKEIKEINSGAYWFNTGDLISALGNISPTNSQGEHYLTDSISVIRAAGKKAGAYLTGNPYICLGANDRKDLLHLNNIARMMIIEKHLEAGVGFTCTDGVIIGRDAEIGANTEITAGTVISGNTVIGENCVIGPNCVIDNCTVGSGVSLNYVQAFSSEVGDNVKIGPFVHIRPGSVIKRNVKIGDFVEIKNSTIGEFTSIAHLTYVGDSDVGKHVNFGCGCVTVNYDGVKKSRCVIGDYSFIGCNTNLIAPVTLGKAVYTAAGSTIVKDVPDYALAIDRGVMNIRTDYSKKKLAGKINDKDEGTEQ